jgi:hypothetical protein
MNKLSKKEINRMYGKNKKQNKMRVPKGEPYKRDKLSIRDLQKIEKT